MLITLGNPINPIKTTIKNNTGTWFIAPNQEQSAKAAWLAQHLKIDGTLMIDQGAEQALKHGASLLPIGAIDIQGRFGKGAVVRIVNEQQHEVARGLCNYPFDDVKKILKTRSQDIETILGYVGCDELVHRNNLVMI